MRIRYVERRFSGFSSFRPSNRFVLLPRMNWLYHSVCFVLLVLIQRDRAEEVGNKEPTLEQIRSPMLEVLMHLPSNFHDVRAFKSTLTNQSKSPERTKREAEVKPTPTLEKPEPEKLVSSGPEMRSVPHPVLPIPDAIRGPNYHKYPVKEFDVVDIDDPDDPRRRRNEPSDDDNAQRDKRTFLEEGSGETTTPLPFWKRKKENPPFITGRGGPTQTGNSYTPAQHRSGESARESHSLKNLDKTVQSNEISRANQDSYYSATNRRAYSRQYDSVGSSTPKSVYDTIDYSKRTQDRTEFGRNQDSGRNQDEKKDIPREARPTHEQYRQYYNLPWGYDRPYYQPAYPYPTEVLGRGVEYYHRTYDPATGRIIYYANMPEQRSYDYRFVDPISRNFYLNRQYLYDNYYRNYVPPFDYRFAGRAMDYYRNGRSSSQAYSYPFQEREKFPRDARFNGAFETAGNRLKDDYRNKTYVIYDVDEGRSQFQRPQYVPENNRPTYAPPPGINPSGPQVPFRQVPFPPSVDYFPPAAFPPRNQFYPSSAGPVWGYNHRTTAGVTNSNPNPRPLNTPEVQLPLTTSSRGGLDAQKKS